MMKKVMGYFALMIIIIVILPLIIVRGCSTVVEDIVPKTTENHEIKEKIEIDRTQINVYVTSLDMNRQMCLEEYVVGVVAAEMPAIFEIEALKAQAVAARTYAYGRLKKQYLNNSDVHSGADVCTNHNHCQGWISKEDAFEKWGEYGAQSNWDKIERAVRETENIIISYDRAVVNPLYHANSGGKTENSENVWEGVKVPYLRSVESEGEDASSEFETVITFERDEFIKLLKNDLPDIKIDNENLINQLEILNRTESDRVDSVRIGDTILKGTDFRRILNLRSTNFQIEESESGDINISTIGYGHGVGMSQWGANHLAKNGRTFKEIIKYYYKGVSLDTIDNVETLFDNY
ncbi:UNVERIFIED_CONTAM: stage II sporulation protein D [Acetivibrio alkalicellulosi]